MKNLSFRACTLLPYHYVCYDTHISCHIFGRKICLRFSWSWTNRNLIYSFTDTFNRATTTTKLLHSSSRTSVEIWRHTVAKQSDSTMPIACLLLSFLSNNFRSFLESESWGTFFVGAICWQLFLVCVMGWTLCGNCLVWRLMATKRCDCGAWFVVETVELSERIKISRIGPSLLLCLVNMSINFVLIDLDLFSPIVTLITLKAVFNPALGLISARFVSIRSSCKILRLRIDCLVSQLRSSCKASVWSSWALSIITSPWDWATVSTNSTSWATSSSQRNETVARFTQRGIISSCADATFWVSPLHRRFGHRSLDSTAIHIPLWLLSERSRSLRYSRSHRGFRARAGTRSTWFARTFRLRAFCTFSTFSTLRTPCTFYRTDRLHGGSVSFSVRIYSIDWT